MPRAIAGTLTDAAAQRPDTDWHLPRLYDFLGDLGATRLVATHSRYVVDLNRPPDGANLYPGRDTPGLVPRDTFDGRPLYRPGAEPDAAEVRRRVERYWMPYHRRLAREIERLRARHGFAVLWDAHSIVSVAPRLFDGRLPDLNFGTAREAACDPDLARRLMAAAGRHPEFPAVLDGRFTGGHITRHYGDPARGVHAIQLEMAQAPYMDEACPWPFQAGRAPRLRRLLRELLGVVMEWSAEKRRRP